MNKLFVYGTLKSGNINQVVPEIAPYITSWGKGFVKAKLFDLGAYPGAVNVVQRTNKVHGEIVEIIPEKLDFVLHFLDKYEEVGKHPQKGLFKRAKALVNTVEGKKIYAWVYWYNKNTSKNKEIKSGIYRQRKIISV
jgi:gamma-glutamylcyclotransferase (GGCT)/AIG2-like uncharacterized protein YtfP